MDNNAYKEKKGKNKYREKYETKNMRDVNE